MHTQLSDFEKFCAEQRNATEEKLKSLEEKLIGMDNKVFDALEKLDQAKVDL